jgi:hypothetical protein
MVGGEKVRRLGAVSSQSPSGREVMREWIRTDSGCDFGELRTESSYFTQLRQRW